MDGINIKEASIKSLRDKIGYVPQKGVLFSGTIDSNLRYGCENASKETIESKIYSWDDEVASNAVEVHVHHLRRKLGKNIIKTINKIGYILEDA